MKSEQWCKDKLAEIQAILKQGSDNPLQASMWQSIIGQEALLIEILEEESK